MILSDSTRSKELIDSFRSGKTTKEDFYKDCVLWVLEPQSWSEVLVRYFPPEPPEWTQYESMDLREKSKIDPSFFRQPVIYQYLKAKDQVASWNKGWYGWLGEAIKWLPDTKEYLEQQMTLQKKRFEFKTWIEANLPGIQQEETYTYEPTKIEGTAAVVQEMFGGSVV